MSCSSLFTSLGAAMQSFSSHRYTFKDLDNVAKSNPTLLSFESELSSRLEQLKSTHETEHLGIEWLCHATKMVLSTHSSAEVFVPDIHVSASIGSRKWIDSFLDNTICLLDTCVDLKAAIAEIRNYYGHIKIALRAVEKDPIGEISIKRYMKALKKCIDALKRKDDAVNHLGQRRSKLECCSSMLRRMAERLNIEDDSNGNFFMVMYAAQVITIFICSLLSTALSFKPRRSLSSACISGQSLWSLSLNTLQHKVQGEIEKKKCRGANAVLEELDMADITIRNFHNMIEKILNGKSSSDKIAQILKVKESAKVLEALLTELQRGIPTLEVHVENIYRNLLRSRIVFLNMELGS